MQSKFQKFVLNFSNLVSNKLLEYRQTSSINQSPKKNIFNSKLLSIAEIYFFFQFRLAPNIGKHLFSKDKNQEDNLWVIQDKQESFEFLIYSEKLTMRIYYWFVWRYMEIQKIYICESDIAMDVAKKKIYRETIEILDYSNNIFINELFGFMFKETSWKKNNINYLRLRSQKIKEHPDYMNMISVQKEFDETIDMFRQEVRQTKEGIQIRFSNYNTFCAQVEIQNVQQDETEQKFIL